MGSRYMRRGEEVDVQLCKVGIFFFFIPYEVAFVHLLSQPLQCPFPISGIGQKVFFKISRPGGEEQRCVQQW